MMKKTISLLGATGSIGKSTLDLVKKHSDKYEVHALTAYNQVNELAKLAIEFNAKIAVIGNDKHYNALKELLKNTEITVASGESGLNEAAIYPSDYLVAAIVGAAGLRPTLTAVRRGATILLANKECLVCAGDLMMQEVSKHNAKILPVDSEHNAIFQVFDEKYPQNISRLIITASGGPFLETSLEELKNVTPAQAVAHPNWDMGAKISIDSATMMNKGLEVIEAYHLFPIEKNQIDVLVHPQSVIHSMVEYIDGSTLAQLGSPDMRVPIASCLAWPNRISTPAKKLNLADIGQLTFFAPDYDKFKCLALARDALHAGGAATTTLNAANEIAVEAFLKNQIAFLSIADFVSDVLNAADMKAPQSLSHVFELDEHARKLSADLLPRFTK